MNISKYLIYNLDFVNNFNFNLKGTGLFICLKMTKKKESWK